MARFLIALLTVLLSAPVLAGGIGEYSVDEILDMYVEVALGAEADFLRTGGRRLMKWPQDEHVQIYVLPLTRGLDNYRDLETQLHSVIADLAARTSSPRIEQGDIAYMNAIIVGAGASLDPIAFLNGKLLLYVGNRDDIAATARWIAANFVDQGVATLAEKLIPTMHDADVLCWAVSQINPPYESGRQWFSPTQRQIASLNASTRRSCSRSDCLTTFLLGHRPCSTMTASIVAQRSLIGCFGEFTLTSG